MRFIKRNTRSDASDEELISQYQSTDDTESVSILFDRYLEMVYGLCLKYLKNPELAKDASMEIYLILTDKLKTHQLSSFKNWLYTVAKNYCFEILRKEQTHREKKKRADFMYSVQVFHPDSIRNEEELIKLKACLEKLPLKQKDCVMRFYYNKESYAEISNVLNLEWNKIRSYIQNGRRNLKNCMSEK